MGAKDFQEMLDGCKEALARHDATAELIDEAFGALIERDTLQTRIEGLERELAAHVPCQACGWTHARSPNKDEELPIVRGALDAQEKAEVERDDLKAEVERLRKVAKLAELLIQPGDDGPELIGHRKFREALMRAARYGWSDGKGNDG